MSVYLKIDPELKALIPPLSPAEYAQLEENILAQGCREPIILWILENQLGRRNLTDAVRIELALKKAALAGHTTRKQIAREAGLSEHTV